MVSDLLVEKEELLKKLKQRITDLEKEVIVWKKASENNSYRALLSEDKYNKQKEINQELVEDNESLKGLLKKLKYYRCKNQHKVISETGKTVDCHAVDCYKMYNCENCGYFKEIKEK